MRKLIIGLLLFSLLGCSQQNSQTDSPNKIITSVELTCTAECKRMYPEQDEVQLFDDVASIQIFTNAMKSAEQMPGILDYATLYDMVVTYSDDTTEHYHLNIGKKKGQKGLLVNTVDTNKGYSIPTENHDQLSELIYKEKK